MHHVPQSSKLVHLPPGSNLGAADADSPSPEVLGAGRADPFYTYPIHATRVVHELVDHCKSVLYLWRTTAISNHPVYFVISLLAHRNWAPAVHYPRSCWELFNLYRKDGLPFSGMLHHAVHYLAMCRGLPSTPPDAFMEMPSRDSQLASDLNLRVASPSNLMFRHIHFGGVC